ncbi:MAG: ImmA/IrrE family metallo-endopeptidase [Solirubrobacteraceae bacterium]
MLKSKRTGDKKCSIGANCKNTCISKAKDCLVPLSPKNKSKIIGAVNSLKKLKAINQAEKAFISKGGSVPAAAKLLAVLLDRPGPQYKGEGPLALKQIINDFYKLSGKEFRLSTVSLGEGRSQADRRAGTIKINAKNNLIQQRKELFHELGHFAGKSTSKAARAETDFIEKRKTSATPKLLSEITGSKAFGLEKAYAGKFPNPYTAKYYISGATEVFSTGFENFSSASDLSKFYKSDTEHFGLIMKYIKGEL